LLQRRAARKQKRSHNWEKAQVKVARLHHHIGNTRKDFHLKTAHSLCDQAQTIFAEDLNTIGLNRGMLRKDCIDASFGAFLSLLEWVCFKRGVYFQRVNPSGTSQICPECQATVAKPLSEREHSCPDCGYRTHRDHAAAQMVLLRGLESVSEDNRRTETACAGVLAGDASSSQVPKSRKGDAGSRRGLPPRKEAHPKGKTRKAKS
jgi:putative transposase